MSAICRSWQTNRQSHRLSFAGLCEHLGPSRLLICYAVTYRLPLWMTRAVWVSIPAISSLFTTEVAATLPSRTTLAGLDANPRIADARPLTAAELSVLADDGSIFGLRCCC